jgi:uncharacterized membrane-anchored protein
MIVKALLAGIVSSLALYLMYNTFWNLPKPDKVKTLKVLGKVLIFVSLAVSLLTALVLFF